ncbi:hypothetical protein [Sphingomonas sp. G-3-2-10]|uniref:hypothetical protein n=1 Tax=Sphingomonas sp. G-3-2-10 TaxID=2728838 RepID=UPI00146E66D4|nr:hypothetical protein [Sphingomonas sp. G-3-2-10]NML05336.1 hypothetical protein [Sphingomonas sp. G-3-2-10]
MFFKPIVWLTDCAHVGLTMGFGIGEWGPAFVAENGRFEVHDWSIGFAGGPVTFLIYDATDQIARPPYDRHGITCAWPPRHLFGHYYICRF